MCGIVGLFLKNEALEPSLGKLMTTMLATMCERGPDSAGFAIYGGGDDAHVKLTVRAGSAAYDFEALARKLSDALGVPCRSCATTRTPSSRCRKRPSKWRATSSPASATAPG